MRTRSRSVVLPPPSKVDRTEIRVTNFSSTKEARQFSERTGLDRPTFQRFDEAKPGLPSHQQRAYVDSASKSILCIGLRDCGRLTVEASEVVANCTAWEAFPRCEVWEYQHTRVPVARVPSFLLRPPARRVPGGSRNCMT